jgi:imidazolonepropionase-like amidohydrolase
MIITAKRIIPGDGKTVLENKAVCVLDGRICEIGDLTALRGKCPDCEVVDYGDASLLPGLIDMHVHLGHYWSRSDANRYTDFRIAYLAADYAKKAFSKGVTTLRDVSSVQNLCASMNSAASDGYLEIPRIISTDSALCFTGGHGWEESVDEINGPWEIRAAIRDRIKRGAGWIKLMASHRSNTPEFTQEELDAAVDECHRVNKKIAVHAGTQPSIQMCIDAGFDTIEHGTYMTAAQAKQMAEKNIVWVPTITAYTRTYEFILENENNADMDQTAKSLIAHLAYFRDAATAYKENFKKLYETGVKIVTGTDLIFNGAPVTPVAREMKYMTSYGMPALEVIRAATKTGAETLEIDNITGEITTGKLADILVVAGNPLENIEVMEKVTEVYFGGKSMYCSCS